MNRIIKFKGKRVDTCEWVYGDVQHNFDGRCFIGEIIFEGSGDGLNINGFGSVEVILETIGQYIGLKDKNGVEIYEGDVFKTILGCNAVVEWEKEGRFLGLTIENERKIVYINREPKVETIGNIHDNPELLEVAK